MRLLFQLLKQIPTHFSKRMYRVKTLRAKMNQDESSIYR